MDSQTRYAEALLRKGAKKVCSACGEDRWTGGDVETLIFGTESNVMPMLPVICGNCGYVRFHAIKTLMS